MNAHPIPHEYPRSKRDLFIQTIFSTVAPRIDVLTTGFSLGLAGRWRRNVIALSGLNKGDRVLDVCTGTGELAFLLARAVAPGGSVTGIDFCEEMLAVARAKLDSRPLAPSFLHGDAKQLAFPDDSFDAVTVSFGMRNIPDTVLALREARRVLRPGGTFLCLELTRPVRSWFLPAYRIYTFRIMPLIARFFVPSPVPYSYLPKSIDAFYPADAFRKVIERCGFSDVVVRPMHLGIATIFRARKP